MLSSSSEKQESKISVEDQKLRQLTASFFQKYANHIVSVELESKFLSKNIDIHIKISNEADGDAMYHELQDLAKAVWNDDGFSGSSGGPLRIINLGTSGFFDDPDGSKYATEKARLIKLYTELKKQLEVHQSNNQKDQSKKSGCSIM